MQVLCSLIQGWEDRTQQNTYLGTSLAGRTMKSSRAKLKGSAWNEILPYCLLMAGGTEHQLRQTRTHCGLGPFTQNQLQQIQIHTNPCWHSGWISVAGICLHPGQNTPSQTAARRTTLMWELKATCKALRRFGQTAQGQWRHDWLTASLLVFATSHSSAHKKTSLLSFSNQSKVKRNTENVPESEREADFRQSISLLLRATANRPWCKSSLIGKLRDKAVLKFWRLRKAM